ncbi:hypothetical protein B5S28_g1836 [[Candida] boidinii]|uniref:Unnamed protein product n=1 Tax=Candida boidinii TaxID=5477 RepID=A0ACB5TL75_CANBO|nr:hypothetical protein B5S28_g1836 [[Candida] boidinii]OWB64247.1 hypothetical protein B5S29_g5304 [[Candida] boidinii]OWB73966.1 hypothetical protein B5S31_g3735 [[Candida] boidinii]OWB78878.1 hypothetical protein B5S32_g3082 [[Candida] boidinii]GME90927.1 unnamed protein product [[Candida] boidinii]
MSSSFQTRRTQKSAINTPVASHVVAEKSLNKEPAQIILDTFIENCESISNSSLNLSALQTNNVIVSKSAPYAGPNSTTLSQLKRLQRELRGLPPLLVEGYSTGTRPSTEGSTAVNKKTVFDEEPKQNKKITFDDEPKQNKKITFDDEPKQNKKITFEDEPKAEVKVIETKEEEDEEESKPTQVAEIKEESKEEKSTIDKEERKRLKKERKKEEKKRRKLELESK